MAGHAEQTPEYNPLRNSGHEAGDFMLTRVITQGAGAPCTYAVAPASRQFGTNGGKRSAEPDRYGQRLRLERDLGRGWLAITSVGGANINYTVAANSGAVRPARSLPRARSTRFVKTVRITSRRSACPAWSRAVSLRPMITRGSATVPFADHYCFQRDGAANLDSPTATGL